MNIVKGDKLVLIREMDRLKTIGQMYEVANITDTNVVLRDATTKIAVCSVEFNVIDSYFAKKEDANGWTEWTRITDPDGSMIAEYRTNFKHVEVRIPNDMLGYPNGKAIRSTAMCSQGDEFNLAFGIRLAYIRCEQKYLRNEVSEIDSVIESLEKDKSDCESRIVNNKSIIKKLLAQLD